MINPMIAAVIALIKTAPAAISFTLPADGLCSGETILTNLSMAVLKASAVRTKPMQKMTIIHSAFVRWKKSPANMTNTDIPR